MSGSDPGEAQKHAVSQDAVSRDAASQDTERATRHAAERLALARRVAVLTGAGVSAASGVPTFRGSSGLWRNRRAEDLATPQAYARDPELVWEWYAARLALVRAAEPNAAHRALAALQSRTELSLATQNVDDLHERAGSRGVLELHGNLGYSRCEVCGGLERLEVGFALPPRCSRCGGRARPNVVWFGEPLPPGVLGAAVDAFETCEVALVLGTSALVEPAASLGRLAKRRGAFLIEVNPEPTPLSPWADLALRLEAVPGMAALSCF